MKLRNIFLAGLAVCTMASCSNDEAIDYSQIGEVDANVSFGITSALQTKAADDKEAIKDEGQVRSLNALIFKGTDDNAVFVTSKKETVATGTISEIKHLTVKVTPTSDGTSSTDEFIAVFLGNCELASNPKTLGDLKKIVLTKKAEAYVIGDLLPMVSKEVKFNGLRPIIKNEDGTTDYFENWVKNGGGVVANTTASETDPTTPPAEYLTTDHVVLTRLISRVQVESVTLKLTGYPGASIELKQIALANVKTESTFNAGAGDYVRGYKSAAYSAVQYWIDPVSKVNNYYASAEYSGIKADNGQTTGETFVDDNERFVKYIFSNPRRTATNTSAAHEDGIYETGVILAVDFTNAAGTTTRNHMRVLLEDNGATDVPEVLMNHIYKLKITITGEGSPNEDDILLNAHVAGQIDVEPWKVITQEENDAN